MSSITKKYRLNTNCNLIVVIIINEYLLSHDKKALDKKI